MPTIHALAPHAHRAAHRAHHLSSVYVEELFGAGACLPWLQLGSPAGPSLVSPPAACRPPLSTQTDVWM